LKGRSNSSFCQNLSKSQIDRFPLNFVFFVIGVNQLQKHVIILKTQILSGRLIRIFNLRRDVRPIFQRATPVSEVRVKRDSSAMIRSHSKSTRVQESNSIRLDLANVNLMSMQLSQIKQI
jgi:hypothetical protein